MDINHDDIGNFYITKKTFIGFPNFGEFLRF